jgi:hypothetical protein
MAIREQVLMHSCWACENRVYWNMAITFYTLKRECRECYEVKDLDYFISLNKNEHNRLTHSCETCRKGERYNSDSSEEESEEDNDDTEEDPDYCDSSEED